ncbi:MAG: DNA-directed RNA polymerase subunit omega [bacterium]
MMLYNYDEMLKHAKSKFHLVNLLARRSRELNRWVGSETDIVKIIPIAIEELLAGKLNSEAKEKEPQEALRE